MSPGLGLDALVCKKALHSRLKQVLNRFHLGKLTYLALTVQSLFTMETANGKVITEHGGFVVLPGMIFPAAMNLPAEGGGCFYHGTSCISRRMDVTSLSSRRRNCQVADFFPASISGCGKTGAY